MNAEKALRAIYDRLGEIRDVLCEIRDGMIDLEADAPNPPEPDEDDGRDERATG